MKLKQNVGAREVHLLNSLGANPLSLQRPRFCHGALKQIWLIASMLRSLQCKLYHFTSPRSRRSIGCSPAEARHRYGHTSRRMCESPKRAGTAPVTRPVGSPDRKAPGQQNSMNSSNSMKLTPVVQNGRPSAARPSTDRSACSTKQRGFCRSFSCLPES